MNREQLTYTKKRIERIAADKIETIDKKNFKDFDLSFDEKYKLIKNGKAKLKAREAINCYTDLKDAYIYPGEEEFYQKRDVENQKLQMRIKNIDAEKDLLLDKIHLEKDAAEVIRLLEAFINKKF